MVDADPNICFETKQQLMTKKASRLAPPGVFYFGLVQNRKRGWS